METIFIILQFIILFFSFFLFLFAIQSVYKSLQVALGERCRFYVFYSLLLVILSASMILAPFFILINIISSISIQLNSFPISALLFYIFMFLLISRSILYIVSKTKVKRSFSDRKKLAKNLIAMNVILLLINIIVALVNSHKDLENFVWNLLSLVVPITISSISFWRYANVKNINDSLSNSNSFVLYLRPFACDKKIFTINFDIIAIFYQLNPFAQSRFDEFIHSFLSPRKIPLVALGSPADFTQ